MFGETTIFDHNFKMVELDASFPGIGLTTEDFMAVKSQLISIEEIEGVYCSDLRCIGENQCSSYKGLIPDLSIMLSNRVTYEVKGDDLL